MAPLVWTHPFFMWAKRLNRRYTGVSCHVKEINHWCTNNQIWNFLPSKTTALHKETLDQQNICLHYQQLRVWVKVSLSTFQRRHREQKYSCTKRCKPCINSKNWKATFEFKNNYRDESQKIWNQDQPVQNGWSSAKWWKGQSVSVIWLRESHGLALHGCLGGKKSVKTFPTKIKC